MTDVSGQVQNLRALESLAMNQTVIHRLHPFAKLVSALVFIVFTASFGRYDFVKLTPYLFFPFVMMALAELPYKLILSRVLIALPFCLFAGLSNVYFDTAPAFTIGTATISFGVLSLATILLKMYLCVMAALLLVATTQITELSVQLRRLYVPMIFVMVFEMTFRYIGVLLEEVLSMTTAYKLRSGNKKALEMRHMGSFVGHLLLHGFDKAERIYAAMNCRGYSLKHISPAKKKFKIGDAFAVIIVIVPTIAFRFIEIL